MDEKEYLMLREEMLQLGTIESNTINFFYAFISATTIFALTQDDTLFILISYIGIIPSYLIVMSKVREINRIGAYLYVFRENNEFRWEHNNKKFNEICKKSFFSYICSHNFPFIFASVFITIIFFIRTDFNVKLILYEEMKIFVATIMCIIVLIIGFVDHDISAGKYIEEWEKVKNEVQ